MFWQYLPVTGNSEHYVTMRSLGMEIANRLDLNYFDMDDVSIDDTIRRYDTVVQRSDTVQRYDTVICYGNTVQRYDTAIWYGNMIL